MTPLRLRAAFAVLALTAAGLVSGTVAATQSKAVVDTNNYIARAADAAKASKAKYGVPRAVTIAQSILESGWGRSGLTTKYKNYFGIKCSPLVSPYQTGCVAVKSYEYVKGKKKLYVSRFRTYSSMEKSFLDHGRLLDYADRYNAAFKYPNDPDRFIREVHKAGYATDPNYSKSVIALMQRYNLYRYDGITTVPGVDPNTVLIASLAPLAQRNEAATGVPASVTIAQGLFHSGSGRNTLATRAKNYFAMVCGKVRSKVASGCLTVNGTRYNRYGSLNDSVTDQGIVLSTRPRYAKAMKLAGDPKAFLSAVAKAGWSSSTRYVSTVYKLISRYGLTKFDLNISTTLTKGGRGAKVTALQHLLNNAGQKVSTTGYFGTSTVAAVKAYQKRQGLPITGRADPLTLTRITPDVSSGMKGSRVASVQVLLKARKYTVNSTHTFAATTLKAVKALQKKYRLTQDGVVGERTWGVLFG
jgi:flagellum-specific peptidoglycan hydrolase FlgJ